MTTPSRAKRIADPNDKFRKNLPAGRVMTAGVNGKGPEYERELVERRWIENGSRTTKLARSVNPRTRQCRNAEIADIYRGPHDVGRGGLT